LDGNNIVGTGNINITGIITATSVYATNLYGSLTGTATTASNLTRNVYGGNGLSNTLGVSELTQDVTLEVGIGTGIAVGANDVSLKNSAAFTGNKVLKWNSTSGQLTDSNITDSGTLVTIGSAIKLAGIQDSTSSTGATNYVPVADGSGGWIWNSITSGTGAISGITIKDESTTIGSGSDITDIRFVGNNVTVTSGGTGIATVTVSDVSAGTGIVVTGGNTVALKNAGSLTNDKFLKWDGTQLVSGELTTSSVGTATTAEQLTKDVVAGAGLTGGGTLTSNVTLNVAAGTGIVVNANDVALKNTGSLTGNKVLKWDSSGGQLTDSSITDSGVLVTIGSTIKIGDLQDSSGTLPSTSNYVPLSDGNGGWAWGPLAGATPNTGITVREENTSIGSSITDLRFYGNIVTVTGNAGIASVTFNDSIGTATTASNLTRNVYGGNGLTNTLGVSELTQDVTLEVGVGTGIAVGANDISLKNSAAFSNITVLKWDNSSKQFTNSNITDSGTLVTIGSAIKLGGIQDSTGDTGSVNEVPVADGSGGWAWGPGGGGGGSSIGGITIKDEGTTTIGTAGSITELHIKGDLIAATAGATGIATITVTTPTTVSGNAGTATTASNLTRSITAGDGLTGGGELTSNVSLAVNVGSGITISSDAVALRNAASLTNNKVLKWNSTSGQLTDSNITDSGTLVTVGVALTISGDLSVSGIATAQTYDVSSDINLKDNVKVIENSLDKLLKIDGVSFNWKKDNKPCIGVIAQNIEEVFPELVGNNGFKSVNYDGLVGVLIEAIKELKMEINELNKKINS
jgi:hypothetical protein